jgi:O-antigen/teichoic acid export membrane protein
MIKRILEKYKSIPRAKQLVSLFSANLLGIPFGVITSIILTRYLGSQGYGDYKFIISIFNFAIIICTFGFFQAGNRVLVLNNDKIKAKEYYGAVLLILGGLFILTSSLLLFYALFDNNIQEKQLSNLLLCLIPFSWILLLSKYFEALFKADNQIIMLSKIRIYPQFFFLITAIFVFFIFIDKEFKRLEIILGIYLATQVLIYLFILYKINISFRNLKIRLIEIWDYNKSFGFNMYLGTLFSLGFATLTEILISYFGINNSGVGFYSLALTFAMPLTYIPNTIATTHYKDFSMSEKIPKKLFHITLGVSIGSLLVLWLVIGPFVHIFYGSEFESVIRLNFIVSIGVVVHGLGDFFNSFLSANGQAKSLRNCLIIYGLAILTFNLFLIPKLGAIGAAYSKLITSIIYLLSIWIIYYKYKKRNFRRKSTKNLID